MLLGIMSDTHDNLQNLDRAIELFNELKVDLVVHCGDFISPFVMRRLGKLNSKLVGVFGNNDGDRGLLLDIARELGFEIHNMPYELSLDGLKVLLLHGLGSPEFTRRFVEGIAKSGLYDVIIYGHSHMLEQRRVQKCLVLNPGEVFGMLSGRATVMVFDTKTLEVEVKELK